MGAAEKVAADFYTVTNHPALAVSTDRRKCLNRTLEAVERMPRACGDQFERFVVLIATNFAFCHLPPH